LRVELSNSLGSFRGFLLLTSGSGGILSRHRGFGLGGSLGSSRCGLRSIFGFLLGELSPNTIASIVEGGSGLRNFFGSFLGIGSPGLDG
jgi:hypothetical protein